MIMMQNHMESKCHQRDLVRGFTFRLLNAIDMQPAVTSSGGAGGAPQNPNDNYINFEPP